MALFMSTFLLAVLFVYSSVFTDISEAECCSSKKYELHLGNVTFAKALSLCKDMGGELATPLNALEQQQIAKIVSAEAVKENSAVFVAWIGGVRCKDCDNTDQDFIWLPNGRQVTYKHYDDNQPDNYQGAEDCLAERYIKSKQSNKVTWDDDNCFQKRNYICQYRNGC